MEPLLEIRNLTKKFPGVTALDHMSFDLCPGEVHVLAGENGAGKSTLTKCILGSLKADEGEIILRGQEVHFSSPAEALSRGIAAVYQELTMVPWLNAAENIFFNDEPVFKGTPVIKGKEMYRRAGEMLRDLDCADIDLTAPVKELGIADQQMVEIAKALNRDPRIIVFDEPTAALSQKEAASLFDKIRTLKKRGIGIIYISHRLEEYPLIADRITVMRDGKFIASGPCRDMPESKLVGLMVGREDYEDYSKGRTCRENGQEALVIDSLSDKKGRVENCSLTVRKGEIVGIAGLVGSGRTELARLIFGIDRPGSGRVFLDGKDVTGRPPSYLTRNGLGLLPEDRKDLGLALRASVCWNITAASLSKLFPSRLIREKKEEEKAVEYAGRLKVTPSDPGLKALSLSGGNQQKVVIAKWLLADTEVVIFDEPTRGIDVGAKAEIYRLMDRMAESGKAVLMISSELPEIFRMSDRIYVMREGKIIGQYENRPEEREKIADTMLSFQGRSADRQEKKKKGNALSAMGHIPPAFYMMMAAALLFACMVDGFLSADNLSVILRQAAPLLVIACGQTVVILTQGTDLSLGSVVSLSCVLWIFLMNMGLSCGPAVAVTLVLCLIAGILNGVIVSFTGIPVFIVTLATQNIFKTFALLICGSMTIYYSHPVFRTISKGTFFRISWSGWIALILFGITAFLIRKTTFGKRVKALGGNPEALALSGSSAVKNRIGAFAFAGLMAGIGGLLVCCRIESGNPNAGNGMEFSAVAAVLLGGTSLQEGKGGVGGTIFGVLLIQLVKSGLMQAGVSSAYQNAIIGTIVLCAIIADALIKNMQN